MAENWDVDLDWCADCDTDSVDRDGYCECCEEGTEEEVDEEVDEDQFHYRREA